MFEMFEMFVLFEQKANSAHNAGAQCAPLRVRGTMRGCFFPQRCRGAHRAPADILLTFDFSTPKTSLFEGGGPSADGGRSKSRRWKEFPALEGIRGGSRFTDGGSRSPHSPENLARILHMLHMLHIPRMPKAYDVFFQRPSGVLPENVEIFGMVFHRINVF